MRCEQPDQIVRLALHKMINAKYLLLEYGRRTDSLALKKNFQVVTKGYFAIMAALAKPSTGLIF